MTAPSRPLDAVVFDLGGVLIDWDPRYLYQKLLDDEAEIERFLAEVCTQAWNEEQDRGRPLAEATAELCARHPEHRALIEAFYGRWGEMLAGEVAGTRAVLDEVRGAGWPVYALSNWSAETFPIATERFPFLTSAFDGAVISGHVGMKKPEPAIFELLLESYRLEAGRTLFIDDVEKNVLAAQEVGLRAHHFQGADALRVALAELDVLEG